MLASLAMLIALLLSVVAMVAAEREGTLMLDARTFYHELNTNNQQVLLMSANLEDPKQVDALHRLLSDKTFNIAGIYNQVCSTIGEERASEILGLVKNLEDSKKSKELEMLLLGPACLSSAIIQARKGFQMWPPTGFPLLTDDFDPKDMSIDDLSEILDEALKHPEWWQSTKWIKSVKWSDMKDLRFWEMVPANMYKNDPNLSRYLTKAFFQDTDPIHDNLGKLLIKSIRVPDFGGAWRKALEEQWFDENLLLSHFACLCFPWTAAVIEVLLQMYSLNWRKDPLHKILLDSKLLEWNTWQELVNKGLIQPASVLNSILELFLAALNSSYNQRTEIEESFKLFLKAPVDWSKAQPLILNQIKPALTSGFYLAKDIGKLSLIADRFDLAPEWLHQHFVGLQAHRDLVRRNIRPLMDQFELQESSQETILDSYTHMLSKNWLLNKKEWVGLEHAHRQLGGLVKRVFKLSPSNDGTWEPKTDANYEEKRWTLAFGSIMFGIKYGIRNDTVLSLSFLRALLQYREMQYSYHSRPSSPDDQFAALKRAVGAECTLPSGRDEQVRYIDALKSAYSVFFSGPAPLPITNAEVLQAAIRGEENLRAESETLTGLTSGVAGLGVN